MRERPVSAVPRIVLTSLALALAAQIVLRATAASPRVQAGDLSSPPSAAMLRLASLGEPIALAKVLMLHLQAADYRAGNPTPYRNLDYGRVEGWLTRIIELDPAGQYPLLAASRIYAEVPDAAKQRQMLEFVYREFLADPDRRWPWLAHAAVLAKHRLRDLPLALRYAEALQMHTRAGAAPSWARQMQAFILEDMDELEAARLVIGGYIESGNVEDIGELHFLEERLHDIEARLAASKPKP